MKGRTVLPYAAGQSHFAFIDPAGGSGGDSLALAIARGQGDRCVICRIAEWRPPFSPVEAAKEVAAVLREYKLGRVRGDRFSGGTWADLLRQHSITYDYEERTKSDLFRDFLPLLNGGLVELLDHSRTINQLLALERTTSKLGKDSIGHPRGGRDDLINAVAGAAILGADAARHFEPMSWVIVRDWTDRRGRGVDTGKGARYLGDGRFLANNGEEFRDPRGI